VEGAELIAGGDSCLRSSTTRYTPARAVKAVALLQESPDRAIFPGCTKFLASFAKRAWLAESALISPFLAASSRRTVNSISSNDFLRLPLSVPHDAASECLSAHNSSASSATPAKDGRTHPFSGTRKNPCVEVFRHAMAIDEWRRMFRLNRWDAVQKFVANPFDKTKHEKAQDTRQVWFAGCHSDVRGGYPEVDSGLSKFPLTWMIDEAVQHGLKIHPLMKKQLALRSASRRRYENLRSPKRDGDTA
jgi:Uncharacterized alpha/beta hydrolase domain (DUF2235)